MWKTYFYLSARPLVSAQQWTVEQTVIAPSNAFRKNARRFDAGSGAPSARTGPLLIPFVMHVEKGQKTFTMMNKEWQDIREQLQKKMDSGNFKVWISPLEASLTGNTLRLTAPNGFVADWVRERFLTNISATAREVAGKTIDVQIEAGASDTHISNRQKRILSGTRTSVPEETKAGTSPVRQTGTAGRTTQLELPFRMAARTYNWRYNFSDFVVGPTNNLAFAAAQNLSESGESVDTLFLSSGPGLGKTHLAQAVGNAVSAQCNRSHPKIEYLTAEEFSNCFVHALRAHDMDAFKTRFREIDLLLLEDVHFLQGKEKMQDEVLATIKSMQAHGGRAVFTSSFTARELKDVDANLVSRFSSGFMAGIAKPDAETRRRILQTKAQKNAVTLSNSVLDLLSTSLSGDIRQMEGCLHNRLLQAKMQGRTISAEMAREILAQYVESDTLQDVDTIIRKVCQGFGLSPEQLASRSRRQNLVVARNTIFYLARKHTDLSLQAIGDKFNRRHSTVLKGIASVERELRKESPLGRQLANAMSQFEHN